MNLLKTFTFLTFLCFFCPLAAEFDYHQYAHVIAEKVNRKLTKKYHFESSGSGGGSMGCVRHTTSYLNYSGSILTKEEIRKMIVECVEEFKAAYNEDKIIRPYLEEFPVTDRIAYVAIFFKDEHQHSIFDPNISVVSAHNGKIVYNTKDSKNIYGYKNTFEEPYEEALKIVKESECQK